MDICDHLSKESRCGSCNSSDLTDHAKAWRDWASVEPQHQSGNTEGADEHQDRQDDPPVVSSRSVRRIDFTSSVHRRLFDDVSPLGALVLAHHRRGRPESVRVTRRQRLSYAGPRVRSHSPARFPAPAGQGCPAVRWQGASRAWRAMGSQTAAIQRRTVERRAFVVTHPAEDQYLLAGRSYDTQAAGPLPAVIVDPSLSVSRSMVITFLRSGGGATTLHDVRSTVSANVRGRPSDLNQNPALRRRPRCSAHRDVLAHEYAIVCCEDPAKQGEGPHRELRPAYVVGGPHPCTYSIPRNTGIRDPGLHHEHEAQHCGVVHLRTVGGDIIRQGEGMSMPAIFCKLTVAMISSPMAAGTARACVWT